MPTIFIFFGFRFMFYANDHEPIHVHVIKGDAHAKYKTLKGGRGYEHCKNLVNRFGCVDTHC